MSHGTRERFMGETPGTTRTSSRYPLRRAVLRCCRRRRRQYSGTPETREKESHPRNEAASISRRGIPAFETGFLNVHAWARQLTLHLCLGLPNRQGRAGGWEGGEDRAIWDRKREPRRDRKEKKRKEIKRKRKRRRETREWRREDRVL